MDKIILILLIITIIESIVIMIMLKNSNTSSELKKELETQNSRLRQELNSSANENLRSISDVVSRSQNDISHAQITQLNTINQHLMEKQQTVIDMTAKMSSQLEQRFQSFAVESEQKLENIRRSVENKLALIQSDNNQQLDKIQGIVNTKLQKTLDERMTQAFSLVNERLEQVYKGLGEMQNLASGVGDLKKVLTNVKTRGIVGEIQLGTILEQILSPAQYEVNAKIKKGFVEFAVKIPTENGQTILLPIDSKFPGDTYAALKDAYDSGNLSDIETAKKNLISTIKSEAKDISSKYIDPPNTTEFALMFLPFEGLYAEAVNNGLIEILQREYHVNVAGPSTMAAMLNSLQMCFRSMAIQKHSKNVWRVLGDVKNEFDKFADALEKTQQRLENANDELNKLVGVRTRQMQRQLKQISDYESEFLEENN